MALGDSEQVEPANSKAPTKATSAGLQIIGATFGGVIVTGKIQELFNGGDTMEMDMARMVHFLAPDPLPNHLKTLTVLYHFEGENTLYLLNASESRDDGIYISRMGSPSMAIQRLDDTFKRASFPDVEIVAAIWGLKRVKTPSVLLGLTRFFSDRDEQGQIRMTNDFWQEDTWHGQVKSWTVYFRFMGSSKIQCVSGLESQALEVPWCRHV